MPHKFFQGIPSHAKRVFKGVLFEVWQWEQEIFDGTKRTFEAVKRQDYAEAIPVLENGKIVVIEQQQPHLKSFYSFIGGRVDAGETPLNAARRELREESGLESPEFFLWKRIQPYQKVIFEGSHYIARRCRYVGEPTMPEEEKITIHEMEFDELIRFVNECDTFRGMQSQGDFVRAKYDETERERLKKLFYG